MHTTPSRYARTDGLDAVADDIAPVAEETQRLRNTLRLNAVTSFSGGLAATAAGGTVARLLGTGHPGWVRLIGVGLCLFAVGVLTVAASRFSKLVRWAPIISILDAGWVLASAATMVLGWYSPTGQATVALVALMVAWLGTRQMRLSRSIGRPVWPARTVQ
ncbi:MAG: hypothetical protein O3C27_06765 [Actinomycetota bacterium]|nr:hypothetical protein [Actinomycetota bacterium]